MQFVNTKETLLKIENIIKNQQKGAYFRFGDGDINLAMGKNELLQNTSKKLQIEMSATLNIEHPNALKALPIHCKELGNWEKGMFPGNHECSESWALNCLKSVGEVVEKPFSTIYSAVALHFQATVNPQVAANFLLFLKSGGLISYFVGNGNVPENIVKSLFGDNCIHIKTLSSQSYREIDAIEEQIIINPNKYQIVIVAMGCSGRPLQKRLWDKYNNLFLFDIGSILDAICGWNTRQWINVSDLNEFKRLLGEKNLLSYEH